MTVEELIAKLGFRLNGQAEVQKFIRLLEEARKGVKKLGETSKSAKFDVRTNVSGISRVTREFERAAAAARKFRQEAERAGRSRVGPGYHPGARPGRPGSGASLPGEGGGGGYGAGAAAGAYAAGRFTKGEMRFGAVAATAGAVVAVKRFASLEDAARELGITAEQARSRVEADTETFRAQAPTLGVTAEKQLGIAKQFAAAGLEYDTAIKSVLPVAKTAKAAFSDLGPVAEAGIASVNNLKITVGDLGKAFDIMAKGGKEGQVELRDIAKALPEVASSAQKLGISGTQGLTDIVAALEIGRKTAPSGDVAANNLYNLFEKIVSDEVGKAFKKQNIDLEKEVKAGQEKGVTAFDTVLELVKKATGGGDPFRVNELFGDMQARNALTAILQNYDEFQSMRKRIGEQSEGTVDRDYKEAMDRTSGDLDKFSAALDRAIGRLGEFLAPGVRAAANVATGALEGAEGKSPTPEQSKASVDKLNRLFGTPPTYHGVLGPYGPGSDTPKISADAFAARFGGGSSRPRMTMPQPSGPTAPSFGGLGDRMDWMKQGTQQTTQNITNNTNTGNDQRTQTASVTVNASGLEAVGAAVLSKVQAGLSSMGASVVKGNTAATGASTAP